MKIIVLLEYVHESPVNTIYAYTTLHNPLQYSCLENPRGRRNQTRLKRLSTAQKELMYKNKTLLNTNSFCILVKPSIEETEVCFFFF